MKFPVDANRELSNTPVKTEKEYYVQRLIIAKIKVRHTEKL